MVTLGDSGTLSQLYAGLTSDSASNAFPKFVAAVKALPNGVVDDDPFKVGAKIGQLIPGGIEPIAHWPKASKARGRSKP
jgi:hypothetical protein